MIQDIILKIENATLGRRANPTVCHSEEFYIFILQQNVLTLLYLKICARPKLFVYYVKMCDRLQSKTHNTITCSITASLETCTIRPN